MSDAIVEMRFHEDESAPISARPRIIHDDLTPIEFEVRSANSSLISSRVYEEEDLVLRSKRIAVPTTDENGMSDPAELLRIVREYAGSHPGWIPDGYSIYDINRDTSAARMSGGLRAGLDEGRHPTRRRARVGSRERLRSRSVLVGY